MAMLHALLRGDVDARSAELADASGRHRGDPNPIGQVPVWSDTRTSRVRQHPSHQIRIGIVDVRQRGEQLRQVGRHGLP